MASASSRPRLRPSRAPERSSSASAFATERTRAERTLFLSRTTSASPLAEQLGCEFSEDERCIQCDDNAATCVPGVYAAGNASRGVQLIIAAAARECRPHLPSIPRSWKPMPRAEMRWKHSRRGISEARKRTFVRFNSEQTAFRAPAFDCDSAFRVTRAVNGSRAREKEEQNRDWNAQQPQQDVAHRALFILAIIVFICLSSPNPVQLFCRDVNTRCQVR